MEKEEASAFELEVELEGRSGAAPISILERSSAQLGCDSHRVSLCSRVGVSPAGWEGGFYRDMKRSDFM